MEHDDDLVEVPCEFCGELYPWSLIAEHQIVCEDNPEVHDFIPFVSAENSFKVEEPKIKPEELKPVEKIIQPKPVEKIIQPKVLKDEKITTPEHSVSIEPPKVPVKNVENQQNQFQRFTSQTEEFVTKTGEKLLVYGADLDPVEDLDAEKQSSKMPNPLTSNIPKEEDVEDINNLSDDDCEETLEDFWKRARDFLKRNKTKIES